MTRQEARAVAYNWGSSKAPGVYVYAFASTGRVQSEEHRGQVLTELAKNRAFAESLSDAKQVRLLTALGEYITAAPVETEHRPECSAPIPDEVVEAVS